MTEDTIMHSLASSRRPINPAVHAVLDYATAAGFFALAYRYRHHGGARALALVNGISVLTLALLTDYPGGVFRKLSFQTHAKVDAVQASLSAGGPMLFGFAADPRARAFYAQAGVEAGVIAGTDWQGNDQR